MIKNNMSFTKEHTQIAKGIAILFMVYHHLFVIPERLNNEYINLLDINGVNFQSIIANFCKICVCIYIFLSGYGFFLSLKNTNSILQMYKKVGAHAIKFMSNYWINGFTQCHACVVQTTTRYAGVHKKLYKKITNRITIRMFKSIVKKKGDFNGK